MFVWFVCCCCFVCLFVCFRSDCFLCFITCFAYNSFQKENLVRDEVSISLNNTSCKLNVNVNETEMRAFLGCLLFLGALKQNVLPTTVVFAAFYEQELVRAAFSRNRFLQLLSYIHFDDKATRNARRRDDVFAPFREFWDKFTQNLKQYYIPGPFITVDEQLVPFRGRCSFLQYLPSKPDTFQINSSKKWDRVCTVRLSYSSCMYAVTSSHSLSHMSIFFLSASLVYFFSHTLHTSMRLCVCKKKK